MATGDVIDSVKPRDFVGQNGQAQENNRLRLIGALLGFPLRKLSADGFYVVIKVPANGTPLSTGLTIRVTTADDPNNSDPGKVYRLGVSGAKLVSGTTNVGTLVFGAETVADVTAAATSGIVTTTALAITTANLGTPVAGNEVVLYIRRVASAAQDTHGGEPVVLNVAVSDT